MPDASGDPALAADGPAGLRPLRGVPSGPPDGPGSLGAGCGAEGISGGTERPRSLTRRAGPGGVIAAERAGLRNGAAPLADKAGGAGRGYCGGEGRIRTCVGR